MLSFSPDKVVPDFDVRCVWTTQSLCKCSGAHAIKSEKSECGQDVPVLRVCLIILDGPLFERI